MGPWPCSAPYEINSTVCTALPDSFEQKVCGFCRTGESGLNEGFARSFLSFYEAISKAQTTWLSRIVRMCLLITAVTKYLFVVR